MPTSRGGILLNFEQPEVPEMKKNTLVKKDDKNCKQKLCNVLLLSFP
jgi:hypothetical protein